jgi:hypothetical protein
MPQENTNHNDVLAAIAKTAALAGMLQPATVSGLSEAELDALTRGHVYAGQPIAPYLRLLTYEPTEEIVREGELGDRFYFVVDGPAEVYVRTRLGEGGRTTGRYALWRNDRAGQSAAHVNRSAHQRQSP